MTFDQWQESVPDGFKRDPIWNRQDYKLATYVCDTGWSDVERIAAHPSVHSLADQLYRALASIGANLAEGYSRGSGADRVRFYEYALGSARESREWYYKTRHIVGPDRADDQCRILESIVRLLLTAIPNERHQKLRKAKPHASSTRLKGGVREAME